VFQVSKTAALLIGLLTLGCGDEVIPPAGVRDAGMSDARMSDARMSDVLVPDGGGDRDDGAVRDAPQSSCGGEAPICHELIREVVCSTLSVAATCLDDSWACPEGYVVAEECPVNAIECPEVSTADFEMHESSCDISVEIDCTYAGGEGVPCPGNLFTCACDANQWSCLCLL
jgi:hypothetical protein